MTLVWLNKRHLTSRSSCKFTTAVLHLFSKSLHVHSDNQALSILLCPVLHLFSKSLHVHSYNQALSILLCSDRNHCIPLTSLSNYKWEGNYHATYNCKISQNLELEADVNSCQEPREMWYNCSVSSFGHWNNAHLHHLKADNETANNCCKVGAHKNAANATLPWIHGQGYVQI